MLTISRCTLNTNQMRFAIYALCLFIFLSCKKDSITIQELFFLDSLPQKGISPIDMDDDYVSSCETSIVPLDTTAWCEYVQGETFRLTDTTKYWVPQYQYELGEIFSYKNSNGQTLDLTLKRKEHLLVKRIEKRERCEENSDKLRGYCHEIEMFYVVLENPNRGYNIYIEMGMSLQTFVDSDKEFIQGKLLILTLAPGGYQGWKLWAEEFDKSKSVYQLTDFYEELTLLNRTFKHVISEGGYFYNKELGLVAFEDNNSTLWVLR